MTESRHVALLRGINVGGKNLVPMKDLVGIFADAGCTRARTYIQSGNVIFDTADGDTEELAGRITLRIAERFGCRTPIVMRTVEELSETILNNPLQRLGRPEKELHVFFLASAPSAQSVQTLDAHRSPPDEFRVRGREIYVHLPNGMARTKLTNSYFDSKLSTISTARTWRTVLKIFELMAD